MDRESLHKFNTIFEGFKNGTIGFDEAKAAMIELLKHSVENGSRAEFSFHLSTLEEEPLLKEVFRDYLVECMKKLISKILQQGNTE